MIRRSSPPRRRSPLASGGPPKKKPRKASEYARIYGSEARVLFVKSLPCAGCGSRDCENHHVENGGMGREASYKKIAPLCSLCHRDLHTMGRVAFETCYSSDLRAAAVMTEAKWIAHCAGGCETGEERVRIASHLLALCREQVARVSAPPSPERASK